MISRCRIVGLVNYTDSPVGPYCEYAEVSLTRHCPSVTTMLVTSPESLEAGRANWGYPKQIGDLEWRQEGERLVFRNGNQRWRLRFWGPKFKLRLKLWTVQSRHGKRVKVPFEVAGHGRLAFQGRRWALCCEPFTLNAQAAHEL